jgi:hypothetical protein
MPAIGLGTGLPNPKEGGGQPNEGKKKPHSKEYASPSAGPLLVAPTGQ